MSDHHSGPSHGGGGGEALADRLDQTCFPARIVGEETVGLEHVTAFAEQDRTGAGEHRIDRGAQGFQRVVEASAKGCVHLGSHLMATHHARAAMNEQRPFRFRQGRLLRKSREG